MSNELKVVELFAGVGGFRLGLERAKGFKVSWANQWEPSTKSQHAFNCYINNFGNEDGHAVNEDIAEVWHTVPEHDLLVGGFPCQDYSVARTLSNERGIQGKKGVLFWEIMNIVNFRYPKYVLLENVDRLLKSPSKQRGRDFSIMLASFRDAGYSVEWRVLNAADYGFAQRRRRIFIFAYRNDTSFAQEQAKLDSETRLHGTGFFAPIFPVEKEPSPKHADERFELPLDIVDVSDNFSQSYRNAGTMMGGKVYTAELIPVAVKPTTLQDVINKVKSTYEKQGKSYKIDESYYLDDQEKNKNGRTEYEELQYLKGPKKIERISKATGHKYFYSEGGMSFPDELTLPGRTMLTSEGTRNRSSHVVEDPGTKRLRYLTPQECEVLNDFPVDWTDTGMPRRARYFCMGNALVVGLIELMGKRIKELAKVEKRASRSDKNRRRVAKVANHTVDHKQLTLNDFDIEVQNQHN
ncbi:MAG TPA: DNA (cytosine-5-)-methyltransferase [Chondromyces sp.]|nr:DNA (cytosine-5-)-methyltransferase [Chondromyces sp.]